jgi:Transcriptional regulators containing a DNA-binding HTH domain and an aminotransferase domain (MocR family) and their eukaryotic orthologs
MRWFALDRESSTPLIRQIYYQISAQILEGQLVAGERLPSTREIAGELGVSRNVAMEAYDQLAAEGFLLGISGAGTYVAEGSRLGPREGGQAEGSGEAEECAGEAQHDTDAGLIDFRLGRPALDLVPYRSWARIEYEKRITSPPESLGGAPVEGMPELREALRDYLWRRRGIDCRTSQIMITSGALHGLSMLADILARPGCEAVFEDPGHNPSRQALAARGIRVLPVPADEEGLRVELLPQGERPALAFVTPSHQFPLGGCLSIQRRIALVEWARAELCLVVEDDYESEFRYDVGPVSSVHRLDPENVAYIGTFSKIFFPSLRLGYLVLPDRLVEPYLERKSVTDRYCPPEPQLAMADFIREGRLDRHIARMRRIYRSRRDALIGGLEEAFGERVEILGRSTGLHIVAGFEAIAFDRTRLESLAASGVVVHPVDDYAVLKGAHSSRVAMGYSPLSVEQIEEGVARMRRALQ